MRNSRLPIAALAFLFLSPISRPQQLPTPPTFPEAPLIDVAVKDPSDTDSSLQVITLFESNPQTPFRGNLAELDQRLRGLLTQLRETQQFQGHLNETRLIVPREGTIPAKKLLLVGLGDPASFTPQIMESVAKILVDQSIQNDAHRPCFAPTDLDATDAKFAPGEIAAHFITGFLDAIHANQTSADNPPRPFQVKVTYLESPAHAGETVQAATAAIVALASDKSKVCDADCFQESQPKPGEHLVDVLVQSPAETHTALQIICLFESDPQTPLQGALKEIDERLHGLLTQVRASGKFSGHLGETFLITPSENTIPAKKLLLVGLGDSGKFKPKRMEKIGNLVFVQSGGLHVARPFFAPNILDGGVTKFTTADVAKHFTIGYRAAVLDYLRTMVLVQAKMPGFPAPPAGNHVTYLAGPTHADDTRKGIEKGLR